MSGQDPPIIKQNFQFGRYIGLIGGTVLVSLLGYLGYVLYPRFDLPAGRGALLLALAAGAGFASFFSPCSFALLVGMLARPLNDDAEAYAGRRPIGRALQFASGLALGAATFLLLVGVAMGLGADVLFEDVVFTSAVGRTVRAVIGNLLIALGLIQLGVLHVGLRQLEPSVHGYLDREVRRGGQPTLVQCVLFGFVYILAGFGCTGPMLVGLTSQALTSGGGVGPAVVAFGVASGVIVALMFGLASMIALAQESTVQQLRMAGPRVRRWGGWILVLLGAWYVALAMFPGVFTHVFPV